MLSAASDVSVVIPTYNRAGPVCAAVHSVLAQTLPATEIIVVDDGSSDSTQEVLHECFGDRIRCHFQENRGVAAARNAGIALARRSLVAFLDSDDLWTPEKLETQVPVMDDPSVVLSATNWRSSNGPATGRFQEMGLDFGSVVKVEEQPLIRLCARRGYGLMIQTVVARRELLLRLGGFDPRFRITEDLDLLFRAADHGRFAIIPDVLLTLQRNRSGEGLTELASVDWCIENCDNGITILSEALLRSNQRPKHVQRALKQCLQRQLIYRAVLSATIGDLKVARSFACQALALKGTPKGMARSLAGYIYPKSLAVRLR